MSEELKTLRPKTSMLRNATNGLGYGRIENNKNVISVDHFLVRSCSRKSPLLV